MGIHDDDIARVRDTVDIVQLIGEYTQIKRAGRQWMALCPFHGEKTASFSVSAEKGVYYCFGCQRSGDAIAFLQEIESLDFAAAVERLAGRLGIQLRYTSPKEGEGRQRKRKLIEAVEKAAEYYHQRLLTGDDAGPARGYLRSRGYDGDIVRQYKIGWAPDDWDQLARHLKLSDDDLRDSGLGFVNRRGRQQDAFRGRVMFLITDEKGDAVGFGGRILPGTEGPKYKNTSTEAAVYDKSRVLYGLHQHRQDIVNAREAIICEGYTDVIGFAEADLPRAVATCGTALTEQHIKTLKRFSADRLVLAFDADAAGIAAAERVYAWEGEFDLDVRVADLPAGVDPADLAREDPVELKRAVTEAIPFLRFRLERVLEAGDLSTVEGRAKAAERALDVVAEHPDPLVRDQYVLEIADRCRIDAARLRELASAPRSRPRPVDDDPALVAVAPEPTRAPVEDEALLLVIHRPDTVAGRLHPSLFGDEIRREAFDALQDNDLMTAAEQTSEPVARLLRRLAVQTSDAEPDDVLAGLLQHISRRLANDLRREAREATEPADQQAYTASIAWLKERTEALWSNDSRGAAIEQLLPWVATHGEGRGT